MELKKLRELVDRTRSSKANPACIQLADYFETFIELIQQHQEGLMDGDYFDRFEACMKGFWSSFDTAAESLGLSPETLKANLNNPDYFPPEQWKAMESIKEAVIGKQTSDTKPKKDKRVRI